MRDYRVAIFIPVKKKEEPVIEEVIPETPGNELLLTINDKVRTKDSFKK